MIQMLTVMPRRAAKETRLGGPAHEFLRLRRQHQRTSLSPSDGNARIAE